MIADTLMLASALAGLLGLKLALLAADHAPALVARVRPSRATA